MDIEVCRASRGGSPNTTPDPEMVEGGSFGRWPMVGDESGDAAGFSGFAATGQCISPLHLRSVGRGLAQESRQGDIIVLRYADDLVVGFEHRTEAELFLVEFRERLAKFGLELHAEKTRLIEFGRFAARDRKRRGNGKPDTFTFLGFTHYCGTTRKSGVFTVWRKTVKKRMVAKLRAIKAELRYRMHEPVASVGKWLQKVVVG